MQTHTTPGTRPAVTGGLRSTAEPNAFPLLAAASFIMLNASRQQKERIIEALIGALDVADGDCDGEPDAEGEHSCDDEGVPDHIDEPGDADLWSGYQLSSCHGSRPELRDWCGPAPTITLPIARVS